jgi:phage-related protein
MGMLPDWSIKGSRPMGSFGQYTQNNMFTNPSYEQQGKPQALANMLRQPTMQQQVQPNPMQPQPYQAGITQQTNMMGGGNPQNIQNWNSQYGSY